MATPAVLISWTAAEGGEQDETWPSLDAFLSWAAAERLSGSYRCYEADEDGDWLLIGQGRF